MLFQGLFGQQEWKDIGRWNEEGDEYECVACSLLPETIQSLPRKRVEIFVDRLDTKGNLRLSSNYSEEQI